jgi:hypothetical protein
MNALISIVTTFLLFILGIALANQFATLPMLAIVGITAIWAGIDVKRLNFSNYKLTFPSQSLLAALFLLGFWIVGFPMFFTAWLSVYRKTAQLKPSSTI